MGIAVQAFSKEATFDENTHEKNLAQIHMQMVHSRSNSNHIMYIYAVRLDLCCLAS